MTRFFRRLAFLFCQRQYIRALTRTTGIIGRDAVLRWCTAGKWRDRREAFR